MVTLLFLNRPPEVPAKTLNNIKVKLFEIFAHEQPV